MRNRGSLFFLIVGLLIMSVSSIHALNGGAISSYTFSCTDLSVTYGQFNFDRDNTGLVMESYTLTITDGAGNTVLSLTLAVPVGTNISSQTETISYMTPPAQNPLRAQLYSNAGNGFQAQLVWDFTGDSPCLPASTFTGPGVPSGYVLHWITCDTPVYDTPAGSPVGSAVVHEGQTFFVNPTPVEGADGQDWTRIFVSSSPDPYIPTRCVGN